jgi:hypothetical protein
MDRHRPGAGVSRPTSRSESIAAFGADRQGITWSSTQRRHTRASMPPRWTCASESAARCHGSKPREREFESGERLQNSIGGQFGVARFQPAKVALFQTAINSPGGRSFWAMATLWPSARVTARAKVTTTGTMVASNAVTAWPNSPFLVAPTSTGAEAFPTDSDGGTNEKGQGRSWRKEGTL